MPQASSIYRYFYRPPVTAIFHVPLCDAGFRREERRHFALMRRLRYHDPRNEVF